MTPSLEHATFVIERKLAASARHAFRFWSEPELKKRWIDCHPDWATLEETFDFREGGIESKRWRTAQGQEQTFFARYIDILPQRRIIYAYEMTFKGQRLSAALASVEFLPAGANTRMIFTEQTALLVGSRAERIAGTESGFDRLVDVIANDREEERNA